MMKFVHRGDILFALLLAFFLCWYNVLNLIYLGHCSWLAVARLLMTYIFVAMMLEVMFALISYVRGHPLFGNHKMTFFSWRLVLPIALLFSAASTLFYFISLPVLTTPLTIGLVTGFVLGTILTTLYFYSLVEKK